MLEENVCRLRRGATEAQDRARQLQAQAELKFREAQDSLSLAQQAQHRAKALEAAGMAQGGFMCSPAALSPLPYQSPALLKSFPAISALSASAFLSPAPASRQASGFATLTGASEETSRTAYPNPRGVTNTSLHQALGSATPLFAARPSTSNQALAGSHVTGQMQNALSPLPSRPASPSMLQSRPSLQTRVDHAVADTVTNAESEKLFQQAIE